MFSLRRSVCLCALSLLLAGCGGGASQGSPDPTGPGTPTPPGPGVQMSALSGSSQHSSLSWSGGSAGTVWRLERRRADAADYQLAAEVDSAAGLWLDSGLAADTTYAYRLSRADGSVLATASVRTGTDAVLTTAAPAAAGASIQLPYTGTTSRLSLADGSLQLALPAGSFSLPGTALVQPTANPLPDGIGPGLTLRLPERPTRALTLSLRYGADEDVDEVLQDRIALRQADGSWWLLPLAAHDAGQRLLQVSLAPSLWILQTQAGLQSSRLHASAAPALPGVEATFVRVKAHKLLPAAATVRTLGNQRFVPVSIYVMQESGGCGANDDGFCVPVPVLRESTLQVLNTKAGFQRRWTLNGSATPDASLGTLAPEPRAGVVYTAPAQAPALNPLTLRFESIDSGTGRRLVLTGKIRVAEDAWVGKLAAYFGDDKAGHRYELDMRWNLDAAQSTSTRRVYKPAGYAEHHYAVADTVCAHTVSPTRLSLAQARTFGQLVVDESTSPASYALDLQTLWDAVLTVSCPTGTTQAPITGGHLWSSRGVLSNGRIDGDDRDLGERSWSLGRPQ